MTSAGLYEFGDVAVDLRRLEVRRNGVPVALEPKTFDVLRVLLLNRDRLVTKEELLETVWSDTFVTPNVLTRAVAQLRKGLGDDAFEARYVETVAKRGYRFIAPVAVGGAQPVPATESVRAVEPAGGRRRWLTAAAASLALAGVLAAAALVFTLRRPPGLSGGEALLEPRRITAGRDSYGTPGVSPDGHAVAYASDRTGSAEIYVASLAPGSRELPVTADGGANEQPAFSPDGQWLAYVSSARKGVWLVPSTGGTPRRLSEFGSFPSWAPDNETLVFTSVSGLSSQALLWTVRLDGSAPVQLTRLGSPPGGHLHPSWSNGGRWIAFRVGKHRENEAWIVDRDGSAPRRVATMTRYSEVRFAPDDRALYFLGRTAEGNDCLMRVSLDAHGRAAGDPERVLAFQGDGIERLSIARDGTAVFQWNRWSANLWAVGVGARGALGPPRQLTFDEDALNHYADFAPDGRIAYHQQVAGRPVTAWVMDAEGRSAEAVSAGLAASVRRPQWAPEGKRLFVVVEPVAGEPTYFAWLDLATRQLARLPVPKAGSDSVPQLSPDGRQLAYHLVAADGTVNVWTLGLDGSPARQVTFDRQAMSYPVWSPDGRWLAFEVARGDDIQVGVVPVGGGTVELLTSGRGIRWPGAFSPDGEWVAFGGELSGKGTWNIYAVSRSTKELRQLTHFTTGGGAKTPAWSPRGELVVFSTAPSNRSLWSVKLPVQ